MPQSQMYPVKLAHPVHIWTPQQDAHFVHVANIKMKTVTQKKHVPNHVLGGNIQMKKARKQTIVVNHVLPVNILMKLV